MACRELAHHDCHMTGDVCRTIRCSLALGSNARSVGLRQKPKNLKPTKFKHPLSFRTTLVNDTVLKQQLMKQYRVQRHGEDMELLLGCLLS
ncbi:hypothetical protein EOD39_3565 [Acipenser ruthenus]|uniref:Uncharacterized protein n=1 Tax=Acipenser ruthenus TaxID=7906 RepID=A0A444UMR9_ACIRT|nr:hypothetical protein EOD39_3565 [Acipenser ruthenus]